MIRHAISKPRGIADLQDEIDRVKSRNLELMQKMDRLERQIR
jgi:ubiquinone biosynthesis protein UbiJ